MTITRIEELLARAPECAASVTLAGQEVAELLKAARFAADTPFHVGQFVRAKIPAKAAKEGQFAYGRVSAAEVYMDDHGSRLWIYVRWINVDGKPDSADTKHAAAELEALP